MQTWRKSKSDRLKNPRNKVKQLEKKNPSVTVQLGGMYSIEVTSHSTDCMCVYDAKAGVITSSMWMRQLIRLQ